MQSNSKTQSSWFAIIWIMVALALFACGKNAAFSPMAPEQNQVSALEKKKKNIFTCSSSPTHLMWAKWDDEEEAISTAIIGPAGGVLLHAQHRLEIPAGALSAPIQVTFSTVFSDTMIFEFEPDGTQFAKPVKLVFNFNHACDQGVDVSRLGVVVWNPATRVWDAVPSKVDSVLEEVSGDVAGFTPHFSRYAITK